MDNKYIKCECGVNSTYVTLDIKHISGENIYQSFLSPLKSSNYKVMRCYNLVFNLKIFRHNIGSILSLLCFICYIFFMIIYCLRDISPLKVKISKIIFNDIEKNSELEQKEQPKFPKNKITFLEKSKKKGKKNFDFPPKKSSKMILKGEIITHTEDDELVTTTKKKTINNKKKKRKSNKMSRKLSKMGTNLKNNELIIKDMEQNQFKSEKSDNNSEDTLSDNKNKKLDNYQLNNLDYDEACEMDQRGFFRTYFSVLMREHIILFTFFTCYDYNLFYIKMERFFILVCTQFTVNGLFFVHETMYKKYVEGEEFSFIQKIPQLLFTLIASHIIEVILCSLSMTDANIYEIKELPSKEKNSEKVLSIIDCMNRKLTGFFVFTFLLFLFYWYFISAFCAVYQNTQIIFLRDSGISFLTSLLDPFIIYGITTLLRVISLSTCCKKKLGCVYKLSDIIPIF